MHQNVNTKAECQKKGPRLSVQSSVSHVAGY